MLPREKKGRGTMHHGTRDDAAMAEKLAGLSAFQDELGATGRAPGGLLTDADGGEIKYRVAWIDGKVVLDFGDPVTWVGLSGDQAKELGRELLRLANPITR